MSNFEGRGVAKVYSMRDPYRFRMIFGEKNTSGENKNVLRNTISGSQRTNHFFQLCGDIGLQSPPRDNGKVKYGEV